MWIGEFVVKIGELRKRENTRDLRQGAILARGLKKRKLKRRRKRITSRSLHYPATAPGGCSVHAPTYLLQSRNAQAVGQFIQRLAQICSERNALRHSLAIKNFGALARKPDFINAW